MKEDDSIRPRAQKGGFFVHSDIVLRWRLIQYVRMSLVGKRACEIEVVL